MALIGQDLALIICLSLGPSHTRWRQVDKGAAGHLVPIPTAAAGSAGGDEQAVLEVGGKGPKDWVGRAGRIERSGPACGESAGWPGQLCEWPARG
ncbi:hypothetical protein SBV1_1560032 [Verrucomicrobia bacterium]|nr:hypothetical protein SBV1_1560032 [Verrucomicrobiota bacterium]